VEENESLEKGPLERLRGKVISSSTHTKPIPISLSFWTIGH